jgi:hypothetical protein
MLIGIVLIFFELIFQFGPFFDQFDPAYREAKTTCDNIKVGMTYSEIKENLGHLFANGPATYVDAKGDGQAWLVNNVRIRQIACDIQFEKGFVVSANMMNEGSF